MAQMLNHLATLLQQRGQKPNQPIDGKPLPPPTGIGGDTATKIPLNPVNGVMPFKSPLGRMRPTLLTGLPDNRKPGLGA